MKIRRYLVGLAIALLGQGALAAQAQEEATLTWTFNADYTVDGMPHSCRKATFTTFTFSDNVEHIACSIAPSVTVAVDIPRLTFTLFDFEDLVGVICSGDAGGSSNITDLESSYFTVGMISGCPDEFGNARITGTYDASAEKISFGEGVATATSVTGGVRITVPGRTANLAAVISIPDGAEINVFPDGEAVIAFNDGSTFILRAGSTLKFESPEDGLKLLFGKLRAFFKCVASPDRYCGTIATPVLILSVRGTDFSVEHKQVEGKPGRTTVVVFSGTVDVIDNQGNITVVNAGEQVTIPTIKAMPWLYLLLLED